MKPLYIAIIVIVILVVIFIISKREAFRSVWAPEMYPSPILKFFVKGGMAQLVHNIDVYGDASYFVYSQGYAKKQGIFDNYSFDKINKMILASLKLPDDKYCQEVGANLFNYEISIKLSDGNTRTINFGTMRPECVQPDIYTGLRILNRLTIP